ncbi:hypothetical protein N7463_008008 [Penicillium fimorum]|uniref:Uncharacterized protein n=1 Tax=Penicillium fimorum TaxID=1882269 RepID=A0A9W9XXD5_9EURO|nr:hypothetical protein N7463_008008 [Penicillium fimorum]
MGKCNWGNVTVRESKGLGSLQGIRFIYRVVWLTTFDTVFWNAQSEDRRMSEPWEAMAPNYDA